MKKLLLTLAAGAALTIGLAGHVAPASAGPVEPTPCDGPTIGIGVIVDPVVVAPVSSCTFTNGH
jgi:hypothetical protein